MKAPELYLNEIDLIQVSLKERAERLIDMKRKITGVRSKLMLKMFIQYPFWKWKVRGAEIDLGADQTRKSVDKAIQDCANLYRKMDESTTINKDKHGNDVIVTLAQMRQERMSEAFDNLLNAIKNITGEQ
jgi:hypothetical protein